MSNKKKFLCGFIVLSLTVGSFMNINFNRNRIVLSNKSLANVEALANPEDIIIEDANGCKYNPDWDCTLVGYRNGEVIWVLGPFEFMIPH